jgi:hypothetical protein
MGWDLQWKLRERAIIIIITVDATDGGNYRSYQHLCACVSLTTADEPFIIMHDPPCICVLCTSTSTCVSEPNCRQELQLFSRPGMAMENGTE